MKSDNNDESQIPEGMVKASLLPVEKFIEQLAEDFCQIIRDEVTQKGYACPSFDSDPKRNRHALIAAYSAMVGRRVTPSKRRVHLSSSLSVPDEVAAGFKLLVNKFADGDNVNPHLNKFSAQLDKNDQLFFDWGINHFHLGTVLEASGFIKRTGPIAYAIVKGKDVYIITIAEHGHWSDKELLETIESNWPELIASWKIDGEWEEDFSSEEIGEQRKKGYNCGIKLKSGNSYISPGGGINCAGGSIFAVMEANKMYHRFRDLHKYYGDKFFINEEYVNEHGPIVNMRLKRRDNDLYLYLENLDWESKWLEFHIL